MVIPFLFLSICFASHMLETLHWASFVEWGVYPREVKGIWGILFMPFIHGDWEHFWANSVTFFILSTFLFYSYKGVGVRAFVGIYLFSGLFVWLLGRESWHIGASGIVYGLGSFLFFSGLIRNHIPLMAISLFVVFMYGSMVWGMIPLQTNLPYSWEGHLGGAFGGLIFALIYRRQGPVFQVKKWPDEDEYQEGDEEGYWNNESGSGS